jgi:hypothetical protein
MDKDDNIDDFEVEALLGDGDGKRTEEDVAADEALAEELATKSTEVEKGDGDSVAEGENPEESAEEDESASPTNLQDTDYLGKKLTITMGGYEHVGKCIGSRVVGGGLQVLLKTNAAPDRYFSATCISNVE